MRRKDKEITDRGLIETILREALVCHLAFVDSDRPYVVAMNFGYQDNRLYMHSAPEGRKIECIRRNPLVCFQMEARAELVTSVKACSFSMRYLSVVGYGNASLVESPVEKRQALDVIMRKYTGRDGFVYADASVEEIAVIRIDVTEMTGKKSKLE
ncbi:MAG: pyridoxamine 5'-phosphate oxidase family protein [Candidatus Zixiibacteriota bacterium]